MICIYIYICMCIYIYISICIYTYIYIHICVAHGSFTSFYSELQQFSVLFLSCICAYITMINYIYNYIHIIFHVNVGNVGLLFQCCSIVYSVLLSHKFQLTNVVCRPSILVEGRGPRTWRFIGVFAVRSDGTRLIIHQL